ncbi:MAG: hypothetical protein ACK5VI_04370 [Opitutia bacterium]
MSEQIKSTKAHDSTADAKAVVDPAAIPEDAPIYRVKEKSFLNDRLYDEGTLVVYRGNPADNLEPANKLAEEAKAAYEASLPAPVPPAQPAPEVGSEAFAKLLAVETAKAVAAVLAERDKADADKVAAAAKSGKKDGDKPLV